MVVTAEELLISNNNDPGASFDVAFQKPIVFRFWATILVVGMGSASARRGKISRFPQMVSRLEGSVKLTGEDLPGYHELGEVDDCSWMTTSPYIVVQPSIESISLCIRRKTVPEAFPQSVLPP